MVRTIAVCLTLFAGAASWAVPSQVVLQGRVLNASGDPLEGVGIVTASLWDSLEGGSPLWTDSFDVAFSSGFYAVALGEGEALSQSMFADGSVFFSVTVGGEEMRPRQPVL
jgi:hypothetical protein